MFCFYSYPILPIQYLNRPDFLVTPEGPADTVTIRTRLLFRRPGLDSQDHEATVEPSTRLNLPMLAMVFVGTTNKLGGGKIHAEKKPGYFIKYHLATNAEIDGCR